MMYWTTDTVEMEEFLEEREIPYRSHVLFLGESMIWVLRTKTSIVQKQSKGKTFPPLGFTAQYVSPDDFKSLVLLHFV